MPEQSYPDSICATQPNRVTLAFLERFLSASAKKPVCVAEIGIHKGATTREIATLLAGRGELHIFDFEDKVENVKAMLSRLGYQNVVGFGNSYKSLDSYNWQLMKIIKKHRFPVYDYVYIDGAHTWAVDALAFLLCDRLVKVGGYIDFDDYGWTLESSPSLNPVQFPATADMYTAEQIRAKQIALIVDLLVRRGGRYKEVVENKIFQKTS